MPTGVESWREVYCMQAESTRQTGPPLNLFPCSSGQTYFPHLPMQVHRRGTVVVDTYLCSLGPRWHVKNQANRVATSKMEDARSGRNRGTCGRQ